MNKYSWFKHDRSARVDLKIQKVITKFGCEGYGLFWIITEIMYSDSGCLFLEKDNIEIIKFQSNTKIDIVKFIDYCVSIELFVKDKDIISNTRIKSELDSETVLKTKLSEAGLKGAKSHWNKTEAINPEPKVNPFTPKRRW